jgi:tetratricopeptide (TPR) repeat protein
MPDKPELKMQLATYYLADNKPRKAIAAYTEVLDQNQDNFSALQLRGDVYLNLGKHAEAIVDFGRALELKPDDTSLLNNLAWVLATSPEDGLRDSKRAVELATKACEKTEYKTPHILSTLAAAFAEDGNFETAIKWSQEAVDLDDPEHGKQLAKELDSYREGQPWREKNNIEEKSATEPLEETLQIPSQGLSF